MLTKFTAVFVLLVVVTMFIGEGSTQDLAQVLKTSFKAFDPNGNGPVLISDKLRAKIHEEAARLNFPQVDDNALKTFLSKANTNNDGKLTLKELEAAFKNINLL